MKTSLSGSLTLAILFKINSLAITVENKKYKATITPLRALTTFGGQSKDPTVKEFKKWHRN
jgi:hypothetical protein